ncbi:helix-turn-helix domain-containing protein [Streptomyces fradiae]|uniref:helix-turn-helix domain-containing protein n=1 Tax=Streptomyces fradiae TaxID=1906 RepID=UPI00367C1193
MTDSEEWLTCGQVAAHFQVTDRTVRRWIAADPTMRVRRLGPTGRSIRVHRSELDRDRAASS